MKVLFVALGLLLGAAVGQAQDTAFASGTSAAGRNSGVINSARELYASARYDEALVVLNGVRPADPIEPTERRTIEQYRALCLLALGRADEAESAIAALVTVDPFYQPGEADASPRVRSTFSDVRQRLLPGLASTRYAAAKQTYDGKQYAEAERQFREVMKLLDDPQMNGRLGDLRVLATGFIELAAAAAAPPPPPKAAEPPPPAPTPATPPAPKVYTSDDAGIVPPSALRQEIPQVPSNIAAMVKDRGVMEITIDEQGRVMAFTMRVRIHPVYDTMLLAAAKDWRYKPATMNGTPVRYRKLLQVTVNKH